MEFNFDSEDNIKAAKSPVKVMNCDAQLWISGECVEMYKWKGKLIPRDIKTDKGFYYCRKHNS